MSFVYKNGEIVKLDPIDKFFWPHDDSEGEGHCTSCHHVCGGDDCSRGRCQLSTCGHWIGCPGC